MPNGDLKSIVRDIGLPLGAVLETIATKGKSPGTVALTSQQILHQAEQRRREEEERARQRAMQERIFGLQEKKLIGETGQREALQRAAGELEDLTPSEQAAIAGGLSETVIKGRLKPAPQTLEQKIFEAQQIQEAIKDPQMAKKREQDMKDFMTKMNIKTQTDLSKWMTKLKIKSQQDMVTFIEKSKHKDKLQIEKDARRAERERQGLNRQVQTIIALGKSVPAAGRVGGIIKAGKAVVGFEPEVRTYNEFLSAFTGNLAKQFGGEKGRLTDQDIARAKKMALKVTDTPAERKIKEDVWKVLANPDVDTDEEIQGILLGGSADLNIIEKNIPVAPETLPETIVPTPTIPTAAPTPAPTPQIPTVTTDEEYDALPSGAQFTDPQGNIRRKP
jgi:hypothetical protein